MILFTQAPTMNMRSRVLAGAAFLMLAAAPFAAAQKEGDVPDHKLSDWSFGDTISGEKVTKTGLKGKVVAIEYWGIN